MTAEELLNAAEEQGLTLVADGARLRIRPGSRLTPELLAHLRARKEELIDLLTWPPECFEAERTQGRPSARLYPLIGQMVETPQGQGRLVNALTERAMVVLTGQLHPVSVLLTEVKPLDAARYPVDLELRVH